MPIITLSTLHANSSLLIELAPNQENNSNGSVVITLTNKSHEPIKVLKWNTPLEQRLSANIFSVEREKKNIAYQGRLVKRGQPQDEDYALFEAGESRTVIVELPTYYKMLKKGEYQISYRGNFSSLTENLKSKSLQKSKESKSTIKISFTPSQLEKPKKPKLTAQYNGCSQREINILDEAHNSALLIAKTASDAMNGASSNTTGKRYVTWFGKATTKRQQSVTSTFSNIYDALEKKRVSFNCNECTEDATFAYVFPDEEYNLYLCGSFWTADVAGTDSRSGTLIHEVSHFLVVAGTDDHVYGQDEAKQLAKTSPDKAINNADNYEFFAENTPYIKMEEGSSSSNPFDNARQVSTFPFSDTISSGGETNIYKLIPSKTIEYTLYTTGNLDTYGILYDTKGNILEKNDDISSADYNFALSYGFVLDKVYYLEIGAYKKEVGTYTVRLASKEDGSSNNQQTTNSNNSTSGESSSSSSSGVPSISPIGVLLMMILTSLVVYRERKKIA